MTIHIDKPIFKETYFKRSCKRTYFQTKSPTDVPFPIVPKQIKLFQYISEGLPPTVPSLLNLFTVKHVM